MIQLASGTCLFASTGKDKTMRQIETLRTHKVTLGSLMLIALLMLATTVAFSRGPKSETIDATAFGTGTQMGATIGVTLDIYEYSTPADRQILVQAYEK